MADGIDKVRRQWDNLRIAREPSATTASTLMTPTTRPSSSTRTTSFDLRSGPTASSDRRPRHRRPSCWPSILTAELATARLDGDDLESVPG
jgi:hypothetical protein